jgi:hypothetical protein
VCVCVCVCVFVGVWVCGCVGVWVCVRVCSGGGLSIGVDMGMAACGMYGLKAFMLH